MGPEITGSDLRAPDAETAGILNQVAVGLEAAGALQEASQHSPLDGETIRAIQRSVRAAKERGWLQPDLKQWFATRGVEFADYTAGLAGQPLPPKIFHTLVAVSVTGLPERPHEPNPADILAHLEWLAAPARGQFDDALVEIAHGDPEGGPSAARLFGLDELDAAVGFAVLTNRERRNVYVGAALRLPDTARDRRSSAEDFYVATAVPIDIDANYDGVRAAMAAVCDDGLVVTTGVTPERRSQHWARLVEPCDSDVEFAHGFRGLVEHVGADLAVKDAARVMRLGGTVAYPSQRKVAKGYSTELTRVEVNPQARDIDLETLRNLAASPAAGARRDYSHRPQAEGIERGGIFQTGKVVNGRERFFATKLLPRSIREFQDENGADPEAADLFNEAFAYFVEQADNSDGRWTSADGQLQLRARVSNTLRRLRLGRLAHLGLYSFDTDVGKAEAKAARAAREQSWQGGVEQQAAARQAGDQEAAGVIRATPYRWIDADNVPRRDVLYDRHLIRRFLSATVAPGGLGKSSLVLVEALAMATGRALLGAKPKGPLRVWYWNGEDPLEELQRRIAAACKYYGINEADLGGRLFIDSGRDTEIIVAREDRNTGVAIARPVVDALVAEVKRNGIDVLVVDPFVAAHAVSENDNMKIEAVVRQFTRVAEEAGCAVELVHHVRKPSRMSSETTVDDARGAGALLAKVRSARVLNAMTAAEADDLGIERAKRFSFFRVDNGKANLMPRGGDARWRQLVSVPVGLNMTADEVGVAAAWEKPGLFHGLPANAVALIKQALGDGQFRKDRSADEWVGYAIGPALELDAYDTAVAPRLARMVDAWIAEGVLRVVDGKDANRNRRKFVAFGRVKE